MIAIYEPKGKALEYAPLALNIYRGCSHACTYCYCPAVLHMPREEFNMPGVPRPGIIAAVEHDAKKFSGDPRRVLLSFTSDCYQPSERKYRVTRSALNLLCDYGLQASVLTKNPGLAVELDLTLIEYSGVHLGTTLTRMDSMEPGAPATEARIAAMTAAKKAGVYTWTSFEPVIRTTDTLSLLIRSPDFSDLVKIGLWNYDAKAKLINWPAFLQNALTICASTGLKYYIKNDLWALATPETRERFKQTNVENE